MYMRKFFLAALAKGGISATSGLCSKNIASSPQYEAPQVTEYGIEVMNFLTTRTCIK